MKLKLVVIRPLGEGGRIEVLERDVREPCGWFQNGVCALKEGPAFCVSCGDYIQPAALQEAENFIFPS